MMVVEVDFSAHFWDNENATKMQTKRVHAIPLDQLSSRRLRHAEEDTFITNRQRKERNMIVHADRKTRVNAS